MKTRMEMTVTITLIGCDDETIFTVRVVTKEQLELLEIMAAESTRLGGGCMPILEFQVEG